MTQFGSAHFNNPVLPHARKDLPLLRADMRVTEALDTIRREGIGERIIYFYVIDDNERLVGVLPTRRLLTAPLDTTLQAIMVKQVAAIPSTATVLDACEFFVLYKFFAFPVIDADRRVVGMVDVNLFTEEMMETEPERPVVRGDDFFEALGFHLAEVRDASPWRFFRYRFPWLLVTVASGTICALLARFFEATLAKSLVIAFFLTMVLGLNESVSTQSMSVTIQALRSVGVTWRWFAGAFRREFATAGLLGFVLGTIVGLIVWLWRDDTAGAFVIGGSIALSVVTACLFGLSVPSVLHRYKLDPKIAAGPITLGLADVFALLMYFTSAWLVFG
ncbi:MAG TPA: magnesium transporter [Chthoniobacterales bacterium]|nr:magnesium transporter [Chthoniobacterales bacterium]